MGRDTQRANLGCVSNGCVTRIGDRMGKTKRINRRLQMEAQCFGTSP